MCVSSSHIAFHVLGQWEYGNAGFRGDVIVNRTKILKLFGLECGTCQSVNSSNVNQSHKK